MQSQNDDPRLEWYFLLYRSRIWCCACQRTCCQLWYIFVFPGELLLCHASTLFKMFLNVYLWTFIYLECHSGQSKCFTVLFQLSLYTFQTISYYYYVFWPQIWNEDQQNEHCWRRRCSVKTVWGLYILWVYLNEILTNVAMDMVWWFGMFLCKISSIRPGTWLTNC